ncbi:MAG: S8/S53 family peptidase [Flavobacteriaceae bacterium]|nr:S8/S53 family peptidase [Flavobacteriaceae bacterium]
MKNVQKIITLIVVIIIFSCSNDDSADYDQINKNNITTTPKSSNLTQSNKLNYSQNELIIQYKPGTSNSMKYTIRENHGIDGDNINPQQGFGRFEICRCDNQDIEIWNFPYDIDIEPKKQAIKGEIGNETFGLLEVDFQFVFGFDETHPGIGTATDTGYISYIKPINTGITVAVLDTGIATQLTVFNEATLPISLLYNGTATAVGEEQSGWDFVNKDPNTFDDNLGMHGSIISHQITENLSNNNIPHQILPIKIANQTGKISYFNLLCGVLYALERADVLNMSLGWYDDGFGDFDETILANIFAAHSNIPIVTSVGNSNNDNDSLAHYPSSYPYDNVIAVAACNAMFTKASYFSNFGGTSVDFFTLGEDIPFYGGVIKGTSFAAPYITAHVARLLYLDYTGIDEIRLKLDSEGLDVTPYFMNVGFSEKLTVYGKYLYP